MIKELITIDDFIEFYEAIPEDKWCTKRLLSTNGSRCAIGHLGRYTPNAQRLMELFSTGLETTVTYVNDGFMSAFTATTPKQRILNALTDIKSRQTVSTL